VTHTETWAQEDLGWRSYSIRARNPQSECSIPVTCHVGCDVICLGFSKRCFWDIVRLWLFCILFGSILSTKKDDTQILCILLLLLLLLFFSGAFPKSCELRMWYCEIVINILLPVNEKKTHLNIVFGLKTNTRIHFIMHISGFYRNVVGNNIKFKPRFFVKHIVWFSQNKDTS
jgi:hypothetical protein